jgi:hypothetical protein
MPRLHVLPSVAFVLPGFLVASAGAQVETWRRSGDVSHESLGESIAIVADYDGDGTRDLLVGASGKSQYLLTGRAVVLSGTTLALIREIAGPTGEQFGAAVADAGDIDGDGVTDLFVGSEVPGFARAYSGATGALLLQLSSAVPADRFGASGVGLGDVDGDGLGDLAIGAPSEVVAGVVDAGVVRIVSGATGATLHAIVGSHLFARVGGEDRIANAGDVDGDGSDDLALLDAEVTTGSPYSVLRVMSGATGLELWAYRFDQVGYRAFTLESVANVGDLDGDGIAEIAAGGMPNNPLLNPCRAFVLSGAAGTGLLQVDAGAVGSYPAWMVVGAAGDVDGDLLPDFVISTTETGTSSNQVPELTLRRGSDGAVIGTITGTPWSEFGHRFAAGIDSDLDGTPDVAISESSADRGNVNVGELRLAKWPGGSLITRITGDASDQRFRGDLALIDDVDGDGANDGVAADPFTASHQDDGLRVHSGRDGSLLLLHLLPVVPDGELVALPDQDGDGHDDVAFGESVATTAAAVEVRSSVSGARLLRIPGPGGTLTRFGDQLAVGIQAGGALQLAIGAPLSSAGTGNGGEVQVWDVATGTMLFQRLAVWNGEHFGNDVAFLGDVDGDGVGDWAIGAPLNDSAGVDAGRVVVVSGVAGATIQILRGTVGEQFGERVAGVGDVDGDGVPDLGVAAPMAGTGQRGEVRVYRGGAWTQLAAVRGIASGDRYGSELDVVRDVNGDGVGEWMALGSSPPRYDVRSGATTGLLARLDLPSNSAVVATPAPWQSGSANGDAIADLLFADPIADQSLTQAWLVALDDLLFQLTPTTAKANDTVFASARGGPVGGPVALELVAFGGAPIRVLVDFATFDSVGTWTTSDTIPPGLSGLTAELRAWALGFNGRLVSSPVQTLTFQ